MIDALEKAARRVIENPFWISGLKPGEAYARVHDDHDGTYRGRVSIIIDEQGDAWLSIDSPGPFRSLRFRTWGGGGMSLRTRNALMILAEAIRLDNEERPQEAPPIVDRPEEFDERTYHIDRVRDWLPRLSPEKRLELFAQLSDGYCEDCGGDKTPCHCTNDE